jgi:putative hydrolase of the HAD superfamily
MANKWVILDAMGVIFEVGDDTNDLLVPYIQAKDHRISAEAINALYVEASLGRISSLDFWQALGLGDRYPGIERDYLDTCLRIDPEFGSTVTDLARTYSLAMLSNDVSEWSQYLLTRFDLKRWFQAAVISGDVGYRKPDKRIYRILLDRIERPPEDCALVDDRPKNLQAASELGFKTIRFVRDPSGPEFSSDGEIRGFPELAAVAARVFHKT